MGLLCILRGKQPQTEDAPVAVSENNTSGKTTVAKES